jgi:excisionase family DNA binding protein
MAKQGQKLLRVGAAAHELGLHPLTVLRWIKAGRIQIVQVGREMLILLAEIEHIVGTVDGQLLMLYGRVGGLGQLLRLQARVRVECKGMETLLLSKHRQWPQGWPQAATAAPQAGVREQVHGDCHPLRG